MKPFSTVGELTFTIEPWATFYEDSKPLQEIHWQEVGYDKELMRLNINEAYYQRCAEGNEIVCIAARYAGRMVGYLVWMLFSHPHHHGVLCAENDAHFMLPEYRRGRSGYDMLKSAVLLLKTAGVKMCYISESAGHQHPMALKRLGFSPMDVTYSCDLTRGGPR